MKRLIQRLKTILRTALSQLGLSAATPSRDAHPVGTDQTPTPLLTVDHEKVHKPRWVAESDSVGPVGVLDTDAERDNPTITSDTLTSVAVVESHSDLGALPTEDESDREGSLQLEETEFQLVTEETLPTNEITGEAQRPPEAATEETLVTADSPVPSGSVAPDDDSADHDGSQCGGRPDVESTPDRDLMDSVETEAAISQQPTSVFPSEQNGTRPSADRSASEVPGMDAGQTPDSDPSDSQHTGLAPTDEAETDAAFSSIYPESSTRFEGAETEVATGQPHQVTEYVSESPLQRLKASSRSRGTAKLGTSRQPAPAEEAREYMSAIRDISILDGEYARWNRAVAEQVLLPKRIVEGVYLCITPRILASAFAEAGFDILTPDEAQSRFTAAVANVYLKRVLSDSEHLRVLRRCGDEGVPDCVAFLAASVLAAYHMQSDEETSANAYYRRLGDLLGCEMSGAHPAGFSPTVFESLWVFVSNWLEQKHQQRLIMPRSDIGLRRFVALPLAHVPLRRLDIEKLPSFFGWAGYEPQSHIHRDKLYNDLRLWQQATNALTQTGAQALFDDRSDAVLAQVIGELESWDGSFSESLTRRSAIVEIQFDIVQRQPILAYLARRPSGFPSVFTYGERVLEASDEGWYDPCPIRPTDGKPLADGFEWQSSLENLQFTLRRSPTGVLALAPSSSYSGFLSSRYLPRGIKCAVLCQNDLVDNAVEYLSEVARQSVNAVTHPLLPTGWSIIREVTARQRIETPVGLEPIEVDPNIDVLISGGLRSGRRWSWLAGAPPRVLVTGIEEGDTGKINGVPFEVSATGELICKEFIAEPGEYLIEAGRVRRRLEVVEPTIPPYGQDTVHPKTSVPVALPRGSWTVIGASPGEVCIARGFLRGTLASCSFSPIWAIQVAGGPGARVAVLANSDPPPQFNPRRLTLVDRKTWREWASVIYNANIRHPQFVGINGILPDQKSELLWRQYAFAAKQIKRALKRM